MHRYGSFCFLLFLLIFSLHGQDAKKLPEYQSIYNYAEKLFNAENASETTDSIALVNYLRVIGILEKERNYNQTLADAYFKCGILQMSKKDNAKAIDFFRNSIVVVSHEHTPSDSLLFKPYLYIGSIYYDLNYPDSAVYFYKKAEAINDKSGPLNESERLYNKLGAIYYETGDYKKSINYFEKAVSMVETRKPLNIFFIVNYKNNIANVLLKMGQYQQARKIFNELLPYHIAENELLYNLGNAYMEEGNDAEALNHLRLTRGIDLEKSNSMTKIFIRNKQYDSARYYLSKAELAYQSKGNQAKKIDHGVTLINAGNLKVNTGKLIESIADYQQAITFLDPVFSDTSTRTNPVNFSGLQSFSLLFEAIVSKAAANKLVYDLNNDPAFLKQSLDAYTSAIMLSKHIERTYFSDDTRLFLKNKVTPATRDAVDVAILLYQLLKDKQYLDKAFGLVENNKASVLRAGIQHLELSTIPGMPVALLTEEKKLKSLISKFGIQASAETDSLSLTFLQKKIQNLELSLAGIQEKLNENPVYHELSSNVGLAGIDSIRSTMLDKDGAILSYYYTSGNLLCFYLTKEEAGVSAITLSKELFTTIASLRKELEFPAASGRNSLFEKATVLYGELIKPVFEKIKFKKRLVIIPYNEISYLPFEMMTDSREGDMLLKKFDISYNYSANFIVNESIGKTGQYSVLAMAPFSGEENLSDVLPTLPSSGDEISGLPGKSLTGSGATKLNFISFSEQYPVIHLATHAVANDTDPLGSYIEFYGLKKEPDTSHRLYEAEVYNLDLKSARLVILSACETGNGMLANGEGIISLSRAFSYAGCKSVVTSLWKADDMATAFIIKKLHIYLQKGYAKDEALRKAKLDYLDSHEIEDRYKTPAYWAHLVLIGNYQPLVNTSDNSYLLLAALAFIILLFIFFWKKRNRA